MFTDLHEGEAIVALLVKVSESKDLTPKEFIDKFMDRERSQKLLF